MAIHDAIERHSATLVVQAAAVGLALRFETGAMDFRRAWIRDLGRLARTYRDDWVISAYAVQIIRQLRGQLPIT